MFIGRKKNLQNYMWDHDEDDEVIPMPFIYLGNWWGNDPQEKKQVELDVVGLTADNLVGYFGECKWKNEPISRSALEKLINLSNLISVAKRYYYLFSKSGFTDSCTRLAEQVGCKLISFDQM